MSEKIWTTVFGITTVILCGMTVGTLTGCAGNTCREYDVRFVTVYDRTRFPADQMEAIVTKKVPMICREGKYVEL